MSLSTVYQAFLNGAAICTDTRKIENGCIFFALKGPTFDGNTFALKAIESGAALSVVDDPAISHPKVIHTSDVLTFLQDLARHHRRQLNIPVIGITGSNGKTTTKELVSRVMSKKFNTYYTLGNLNNHIGVPLTVLSINSSHQAAVVEMGANHQKEIELLCSISMPTHVLITNVGKAHLEGFGGFEGVKKGKGEMYQYAKGNNSLVFINAANPHLIEMLGNYDKNYTYGLGSGYKIEGSITEHNEYVSLQWRANAGEWHSIQSQITGQYNAENILAAVAIGVHFEIATESIKDAIESYIPDNQRSQVIKMGNNTVVMDAYNANPTSMEAALKNFRKNYADPTAVFIGEMLELGEVSAQEHQNIINLISSLGFTEVVLVGAHFGTTAHQPFKHFVNSGQARDYISSRGYSGYHILIKGSRGSKMEIAAQGLSS